MDLSPGTRLGPYEIVAPLGAGGMGHVYRATDTRLRREVAIKLMADRFTGRADLRDRFRTEALAVAALNHPNICHVYDIGLHGDADFIVMELVAGETLADRLARGRLALAETLQYAQQLAAALGTAHLAGIVHRDIKPLNIMLGKDGVKLLDFGLARLPSPTPIDISRASTITPRNLTTPGSAMGTWPYMAPEQIRGEPSDARSDVFALGDVIYEMASGRPAFTGATHQDLVAAILEHDPAPLDTIVPGTPVTLSKIVTTCLQKAPEKRWQTGGDVHRALGLVQDSPVETRPSGLLRWIAGAAAVAAIATAGFAATNLRSRPPTLEIRATIPTAAPIPVSSGSIAISPDGRTIVYRDNVGLWRYDVGSGTASQIDGTDNGAMPFFSPDGQWLGFSQTGYLVKMPVTGGNAVRIVTARNRAGASWGDDGFIVYQDQFAPGLKRVNANAGEPQTITTGLAGEEGEDHRYPQVLPGGRRVLFAVGTGQEPSAKIAAIDLDTGIRKDLIEGSFSFRYVRTGHIAYTIRGTLYAAAFDPVRLEITGQPFKIAEGVEDFEGNPEFDFAANGDFIYQSGTGLEPQNQILLVGMDGTARAIGPPGYFLDPRFSPDGTHIAVRRNAAKNNTWVYDLARDALTQVTFGAYHTPAWTPDGRLTIPRGRPGKTALVVRSADGSGQDEVLVPEEIGGGIPGSWTPDGRTLISDKFVSASNSDIFLIERGSAPRTHISTPRDEFNPRLSPNGRLLAYTEEEGHSPAPMRIMIESFPSRAARAQASTGSAMFSAWSADSRRLFYRGTASPQSPPGTMWAVDVISESPLKLSEPRRLFTLPGSSGVFDVSPDGKQFVMIKVPPQGTRELHLVVNGFAQR